jgi:anti-sigma-K factor RskA
MAYSEDHIALAAEYALGTLDADERTQVETMMAVDTEFAGLVQSWEFRLGSLTQRVGRTPSGRLGEHQGGDRPFLRIAGAARAA